MAALRAGTGYALKAVRSVRLQPLLPRAGEALPPKICAEYGSSASRMGRLFSTARDPDSLVRDSIKAAVSKGLKEALGHLKNDRNSILKLSVIKSGVNIAVKDSLKGHSVFIDYAEHHVDPVVKLAIEEAVLQGLNKFAYQLYNAPRKGEMMGPYLLKLALKEGISEGVEGIHSKFSLYVGEGIDLLIRELSLIKGQTKPKPNVNEDFIQAWFCGLVHKFLHKNVIWCVEKGWIMVPYVAGSYLFVLFGMTLIESKIPPWEYHKVLNCYRVHGLESALKFYKKKKAAEEAAAAAAAAKKEAEEAAAAAKEEAEAVAAAKEEAEAVAAAKEEAEAVAAAAAKKAEDDAAAGSGGK